MQLFDTHAHLDDEQIYPHVERFIESAIAADVVGITAVGTTVATSQSCAKLAGQYSNVFASVGIHPNQCKNATPEDWQQIVDLVKQKKVVALGETGLDRYWDYCPLDIQRHWFSKHIELSFETQLPLVIHMRDCEGDILELLRQHQQNGKIIGIMHSFTGSWETAKQCLDWGMYVSFAGMLTYKKSDDLRNLAAKIPADRILVETDSPYLSPHPHRSERPNHPAMVRHTADCLAEVRGVSVEELAALTTQNARRVFGIHIE